MEKVNLEELKMEYARFLAEKNDAIMYELEEEPSLTFEFEGVSIHNPFRSECGRFEEEPISYYGEAFLNSVFCDFINYKQFEENEIGLINDALVRAYHYLVTGEEIYASMIVGSIEAQITGRGNTYETKYLLDYVGDGYDWIDLESNEQINVVANSIRKLYL